MTQRDSQTLSQITPLLVGSPDQFDLVLPGTSLDLLLSGDGGLNIAADLEEHQLRGVVSPCEAFHQLLPVFIHTSRQVVGNARVEDRVGLVGHDVYVVLPAIHSPHPGIATSLRSSQ